MSDHLEGLMSSFQDCLPSYLKVKKTASEQDCVILLSKFGKSLALKRTDANHLLKTFYFILEKLYELQKSLNFPSTNIEKCFRIIFCEITKSYSIDKSSIDTFLAVLKLIKKFIEIHIEHSNISAGIYQIVELISTLLWRYILKFEVGPMKLIQTKIIVLNFCIFPPHYTITRSFLYQLMSIYKTHLEESNEEEQTKISQIIVNQSLKWLQIPQINVETIQTLINSDSNFFSLILVQIITVFSLKEGLISGKLLLKNLIKELSSDSTPKPPILSISLILVLIKIYSAENRDVSPGLCGQIETILASTADHDTCPFYPPIYQLFSILMKETMSLVDKQTNTQKTLYYKWVLRILAIFSRELSENFEEFCLIFADEIEFKLSVQLNTMRSAYQYLHTLVSTESDIQMWVLTFTNFYRIVAKSESLKSHFKNQSFDNYVTASLIRFHHIAFLAIKSPSSTTAMEFILNSFEMTSSILSQAKFESSPEVLHIFEIFVNFLQNISDEVLTNFVEGVKSIIQGLSLDFHLKTEVKSKELFRKWIRTILTHSHIFNETMLQILNEKYEIPPKETDLIIETEKEVLLSLSETVDIKLVDIILNNYCKQEISFETLISENPVAPLLKISYLYDVGEWNVALEQIDTILGKLKDIFDTKMSIFSIQTFTLANFWFGLLSYQIENNRKIPLVGNYAEIGTESDSVHIPNIPQGFMVATEYIHILLRYFIHEISESFVKELEFVLKNLIFIFKLFSNIFYLFLTFTSSSIYLSEFCTNNLSFGIQILNDFSELSIENGFENIFPSLGQIYRLLRKRVKETESSSYETILNSSKFDILSTFLNKIGNDVTDENIDCFINSNTLNSLIELEKEYFAFKNIGLAANNQILVYTHSHLVDLCKNFRKVAYNLITEVKTGKNIRSQEKGFSFLLLPSFLQRIYNLSQILIQSGNTHEATYYIDLGFQMSGKLNLFEWRLQFLTLGIQLEILREKVERIEDYSGFVTKMQTFLAKNNPTLPENVSNGFGFLLKSKKMKITRNEFKNFCCITRKTGLVSNQMILENFNKILQSSSRSLIDLDTSLITKADFKTFQENLSEIITNLHRFFSKVENVDFESPLQIERFPPNEHNLTTKMFQIQSLTNKLSDLIGYKSAVSVYKTGVKLISGMRTNFLLKQPQFCQVLSEFYLQAAKVLENINKQIDKQTLEPQCCLPTPNPPNPELIQLYTNCLKSTMPYGSVIILKEALLSLAEIHSDFDPVISAVYFNAAFGLNLRHLSINRTQDKQESDKLNCFDVFCFDPVTYSSKNSFQENFLSSLMDFPQDWTILTISWPKKGDNLYVSRLRTKKTPLLLKIPVTQLLSQKEYRSHEDILNEIFTILYDASKSENIANRSQWWNTKTRTNNALCETLTRIELDWFSQWKGIFLGRLTIARDLLAKITNEIVEFVFKITDVPNAQREYLVDLLELLLESFQLLKRSHLDKILSQFLPNLTETEMESITKMIYKKSEELYEELADYLDKFECTPTSVPRGHIFLILDPHLHRIPWENLPILSTQSVSRVPSLHFLFLLTRKYLTKSKIDLSNGFYVLNPQGDLLKCEKDFKKYFNSLNWQGVAGEPPQQLIDSVSAKDLYVYCGHGSGSEYVNREKLLNSEGRAFTMLMGCSTSKLVIDGVFEYPNMLLFLLLAGFPTIIGNLWFVTDTELNLFTKKLIQEIVKQKDLKFSQDADRSNTLFRAFQEARLSCKHRYITGSAPVIYGLPLY